MHRRLRSAKLFLHIRYYSIILEYYRRISMICHAKKWTIRIYHSSFIDVHCAIQCGLFSNRQGSGHHCTCQPSKYQGLKAFAMAGHPATSQRCLKLDCKLCQAGPVGQSAATIVHSRPGIIQGRLRMTPCVALFLTLLLSGSVQTLVFEILGLLHNFMTDIFAQLFLNVCLRDWGVIAREWLA